MKNILVIVFLLISCLPGRIVFAEEQQKETPKTAAKISEEDMQVIEVLEVLKMMDLMENMDLAKDMEILIEEEDHEDTD